LATTLYADEMTSSDANMNNLSMMAIPSNNQQSVKMQAMHGMMCDKSGVGSMPEGMMKGKDLSDKKKGSDQDKK
jgi:hypothetical protein